MPKTKAKGATPRTATAIPEPEPAPSPAPQASPNGSRPAALVTGASRGIGRATCLRLARDGYDIIALARNEAELEALGIEIAQIGRKCRLIALDLAHPPAIAATLYGVHVDVLVNNAGMAVSKPFTELAPDEWHRMIDVNVNALYHVTRAVLPGMIERGHGHVCTIGSIAGRSAFIGGSCYSGTKAFVTAWSESLMLEVRDRGVKVSVVMPGGVATEFGGTQPTLADAWKLAAADVADAVSYVVGTPDSVLVHRLEVRTLNAPPARR
ncbi:MAG: SDR family NAD(P)-dependent oxidoreductase [Gemmatimonadaceae bacterium]